MDDEVKDGKLTECSSEISKKSKSKAKIIPSKDHIIRKRAPYRLPKKKNEIFVNNKTNFKAYLSICEKILDSDAKEVIIRGLGRAVKRARTLATQLKEIHHDTLELDIKTSVVDLTDDLEPKTDDGEYEVIHRQAPAVYIRISQTAQIGSLRFDN